jgi:hypothetical protein
LYRVKVGVILVGYFFEPQRIQTPETAASREEETETNHEVSQGR